MVKNMENDNNGDQTLEANIKKLDGSIIHPTKIRDWLVIFLLLALCFAGVLLRNSNLSYVPIYLIVGIMFYLMYLEKRARDRFMQRFALLAGFQYQEGTLTDDIDAPYLQIGRDRSLEDVVVGTFQTYPLRFFNFNCIVGYGKYQHTITFSAAQIGYRIALPHIFLDAHHHFFVDDAVFSAGAPVHDSNQESIKLEGDFNKYFSLYAPKGYEIETLQIFTPDIMADLIEYSKNFSLEFYGSNLYIYSRKTITSGKDLCGLYDLVKFLALKLAPEIEKIRITAMPAA